MCDCKKNTHDAAPTTTRKGRVHVHVTRGKTADKATADSQKVRDAVTSALDQLRLMGASPDDIRQALEGVTTRDAKDGWTWGSAPAK